MTFQEALAQVIAWLQREPARTALANAIELYRAMDMAFCLPQAEAAMAQVEAR